MATKIDVKESLEDAIVDIDFLIMYVEDLKEKINDTLDSIKVNEKKT
jgi:FtsZ-binding cell division protein ZapB